MHDLTLPDYPLIMRSEKDCTHVYDDVRKRYVKCTPEERVRQLFIKFLIHERGVPAGLISVEKEVIHEGKRLRVDILVHSRSAKPLLLVECKAPTEAVSQQTFDQASAYNFILRAPYLVVTNGVMHYCCRIALGDGENKFLSELPPYEHLTRG